MCVHMYIHVCVCIYICIYTHIKTENGARAGSRASLAWEVASRYDLSFYSFCCIPGRTSCYCRGDVSASNNRGTSKLRLWWCTGNITRACTSSPESCARPDAKHSQLLLSQKRRFQPPSPNFEPATPNPHPSPNTKDLQFQISALYAVAGTGRRN